MREIIELIVPIKTFCMEQVYAKMIKEARSKEISMLRSSLYLRATTTTLNLLLKISIFICIVCALNMDNRFTASSVYVVVSYYGMLFTSMIQLWPLLVSHAKEAFITIEKIKELLLLNIMIQSALNESDKNEIRVENDSEKLLMTENFIKTNRFDSENSEIKSISLRNVVNEELKCDYLEFKEEKRFGVVGDATKFFELILNGIKCKSAEININASISYASKAPWIFPGSIRENIVFTEKFNAQKYSQVLKICALAREIETLPANDETFIDDVHINDSIKARINLARCVYRDADIYLIDNCFTMIAANDRDLSKDIFKAVIKNFLKVAINFPVSFSS